jgi:hypothetical protein
MFDVLNEDLIDLRAACREKPFRHRKTGKPAHISSMYRHVMRGARAANGERVRLETVRTPSGLRTSREAVQRFIAALTDPHADAPPPRSRVRERQQAGAVAELMQDGFEMPEPQPNKKTVGSPAGNTDGPLGDYHAIVSEPTG